MAESCIITANDDGLQLAATYLSEGRLVAFPTETVYGLGANAFNERAVLDIFLAKGRPQSDPLIVHVHSLEQAVDLIDVSPTTLSVFKALGSRFWPGPLTLIVKANSLIPPSVTAGTGFVGIRCPNHPIAMQLLKICNFPVAAPSANRFGHVSPTRAHHVVSDLGSKGVFVLSGDSKSYSATTCEHGIESTVVKIDCEQQSLLVLRTGAVTKTNLTDALVDLKLNWDVQVLQRSVKMEGGSDASVTHSNEAQQAPGQAITHYAPDVPCVQVISLFVVEVEVDAAEPITTTASNGAVLQLSPSDLVTTVVVDFNGRLSALADAALAYRDLSVSGSVSEAARAIFDTLRWSEVQQGATRVFVSKVIDIGGSTDGDDDGDLAAGVSDRIFRAASGASVIIHYVPVVL
eukprot:gene13221-27968_t